MSFLSSFGPLGEAPRDLWLVYLLKLLASFAYFSSSLTMTLYLSDEFDFSDIAAGLHYGGYGVASTLYGVAGGAVIDRLGVRSSLLVGAGVATVARGVLGVTRDRTTALVLLYTLLPASDALGVPVLTIAVRRYTNGRSRTLGFALFYTVMNVGALVAGGGVDAARAAFAGGLTPPWGGGGTLSALRGVLLLGAAATASSAILIAVGVRNVEVDEGGVVRPYVPPPVGGAPAAAAVSAVVDGAEEGEGEGWGGGGGGRAPTADPLLAEPSTLERCRIVLRSRQFWRLAVLMLLLVGVRSVFRHLDSTLPKYMVRVFGPNAPYGAFYAINPAMIIVLVPLVGAASRPIASFPMILGGAAVAAVSPFWLTALGDSYVAVIAFLITLSVGEAVYSPRSYEYAMTLSPVGQEGMYSSLASAPLFLTKLLTGGMSGALLSAYCALKPPPVRRTRLMWAIIGGVAVSSPVAMAALRRFLDVGAAAEGGRAPSSYEMVTLDASSSSEGDEAGGGGAAPVGGATAVGGGAPPSGAAAAGGAGGEHAATPPPPVPSAVSPARDEWDASPMAEVDLKAPPSSAAASP
ncbi:hypothetical protein BU14_0400s0005 [Porphyra umbilicalis]|uniref:Major facilitator superfamily (MFS) profile domain-containing protein n=1 Tax=Porphyra umbilicalis TaxID=2786 RepID=A0A1X6NWG3_PORUM|nr:hypothetical protein BU14_0400s0005 [Porphyra umbilicalis]|eukprot:OSX72846.1 hypothetical protein BU14_0400s0005 [Porphyra umbilicalis]